MSSNFRTLVVKNHKKARNYVVPCGPEKLVSSFCEFGGIALSPVCLWSQRQGFSQFQKVLSHKTTTLSSTISRLVEKELQGIPRGRARGFSSLPRFAPVCPNYSRFASINT